MKQAVILAAIRTPIAKIYGGLAHWRLDDLLAEILRAVVVQARIEPAHVDEIYVGCANQAGEDSRNIARMGALLAGFPVVVPGITLNRLCASSLDAVVAAARGIWVGDHEVAIAAGVESASRAPYVVAKNDPTQRFDSKAGARFPNCKLPLQTLGETAENIAERYGISRVEQDIYALESHAKSWAAQDLFDEISPVGDLFRDECPRSDLSLELLASLSPAFRKGGTVTPGNSATLNDGAAALVLSSLEFAQKIGVRPLARIVASATVGVDPAWMGLGPVPAVHKVLQKATLLLKDIDVIELSESFAVQSLAVSRLLELPQNKVNLYGGALALGNPVGAGGARQLTTLVHAMQRQDAQYGLLALCVGLGQGSAMILAKT
jgi:acetyl-CoA acetyltransferase family protein